MNEGFDAKEVPATVVDRLAVLLVLVLALMPIACTTSGGIVTPGLEPIYVAASSGGMITRESNQIIFPAYSVVVPPDRGWRLLRFDRETGSADVVQAVSHPASMTFLMQFMEIQIGAEYLRVGTTQGVADRYRHEAERNLRSLGAQKGWRFDGVAMGEELVGANLFFTMRYEFQSATHKETVSLFLYFPQLERNERFVLARYSETLPPGLLVSNSRRAEFYEALKSLRMDK